MTTFEREIKNKEFKEKFDALYESFLALEEDAQPENSDVPEIPCSPSQD